MTLPNPGGSAPATEESIPTHSGFTLRVQKRMEGNALELSVRGPIPGHCVLHWGARNRSRADWNLLPQALWPEGTTAAGPAAMQTPFKRQNGEAHIDIRLKPDAAPELIEFALFFPEAGRWDNNGLRNYQIALHPAAAAQTGPSPGEALRQQLGTAEVLFERTFEIERAGTLAAGVAKTEGQYRVLLLSNIASPLALHWGIARRSPHEWLVPPESLRSPETVLWEGHTAQTTFAFREGLNRLEMAFPEAEAPLGLQFVLKQGQDGRWLKHHQGNFYLPIHSPPRPSGAAPAQLSELAERIVRAEMSSGSWTLMHRYNLCYDLLEEARGNPEALALVYVWLRFSAIRQLTWQRNYNTKPRELAHAQDRLTGRLAELYPGEREGRPLLRLMLASVGRGGDGQSIRDEILQIMHRHHIKEVGGHFLEEWHQKLHNNTTPDDLVICEAYLEFLRTNGSLDRFYKVLEEGGVTRERLESFERPIRTAPGFIPQLKDGLIHDFQNFLRVLKAVHSATDLETAMSRARAQLDAESQGLLDQVWNKRNAGSETLPALVDQVTTVRCRVSNLLEAGSELRPLLYLDLALEQLVRVVIERNLHQRLSRDALVALTGAVLENVTLSYEDSELAACLRHWEHLVRAQTEPHFNPQWSLHAKSVTDRIARALAEWSDKLYRLLQPKAELLGKAFQAEQWTVSLFSEEVVRGSSLGFALSMLLHHLAKVLRQAANLGAWQIVSPGQGAGTVTLVEALRSVQGQQFKEPVVLIADKVMGDEELPKEVVAVIAPDVTDLVSHVAVRARNAQVLFASCSDPGVLEQLKALRGRHLQVGVTKAGDVTWRETASTQPRATETPGRRPLGARERPVFTRFAVTMDQFTPGVVGGKSCSQANLRGKLPDWVHQPPSMALPFGSFEKVLASPVNREAARQYEELVSQAKKDGAPEKLGELRERVEALAAPDELQPALREAARKSGVPWPDDWQKAWRCIKQVWASKWNERAFLSRNRIGMSHEDLFMAVLIQPIIEADYAFVIHTVNPSSGNRGELYAELVLGLGETLVGNFPGRALSFVWDKKSQEPRLLSFPGKSIGLYGSGLIFRSDSNGEDLAGYAGAGLYDSVLMNPPRELLLDYSDEPLCWDDSFRNKLLGSVAKLGRAIEQALGSPQDIEGAVAQGKYFALQTRPQVGLEG